MNEPLAARGAARSAAIGAALLALAHAVTALVLLPRLDQTEAPARAALQGIRGHVLLFQAQLGLAMLAAGALAGLLAWAALSALRLSPRPLRVAGGAALLIAAAVARAVARRPALFEAFLWRKGGARAALQVALAERLGPRALDLALLLALAALLLGAAAAQRAWLRRRWRALAALLILAAAVTLWPRRKPHLQGTPIIVLAADSLRPDHFSSEGYPRATTPVLDALRRRGTWVANELVPIASTTASWATLMTGVYPHGHGVRDLFPREEQTRLHLPLLPALLGARGWHSAVVSDYAGETFSRVQLGFETVDAPPATSIEVFADREAFQRLPLALALFSGALGRGLFPVADYLPVNADPAALTERVFSALDRLEDQGKPFLLVAFYSATHLPFAAPMPLGAAFTDPAYRGPSRYAYELQQVADVARAGDRPAPAEVEQVRALYDGALRSFDTEVGRVLARLDQDGLRDRVVVVTGDHGESLFEPGATTEHGKWFTGGVAANRTALLLEGKGVPAGAAIHGLASGVDFMPTLLDLAQAPLPPGLDGLPLLRAPPPPERVVFAESALWLGGKAGLPPGALSYPPILELLEVEEPSHAAVLKRSYLERTITARLRAAWQGNFELVYTPTAGEPRYQLFDLASDRYGERDLYAARPDVAEPLRRALLRWLAQDPLRWLDEDDRVVLRVER